MNITCPIYITSHRVGGDKVATYTLRPLFMPAVVRADKQLGRATSRLVSDLKKLLGRLAKEGKHKEIAKYAYCPEIECRRYKLSCEVADAWVRDAFAIAHFNAVDRQVAFFPEMPDVWFDIPKGHAVQSRAEQILTAHFKQLAKDGDSISQFVEETRLRGKVWVTTVEFDVPMRQEVVTFDKSLMAALASGESMDGATELARTSRRLDDLYPEELMRCAHRDELVGELQRLLAARDQRPVLLVGPSGSGKSTLLHEVVFRRNHGRNDQFKDRRRTWLLSPQRLISGMSYVGQWENRLLAILKHAAKRHHLLCFDDLIGLFRAGMTRDSELAVAHVLKPYLERRDVRVLGETTPEALRRLRELDRSFADLFHVLRVDETDERTTLTILLSHVRELERRHTVQCDVAVLPTALDLSRRFNREAAFPGKVASLLQRMAAKRNGGALTRETVCDDFQAQTGLNQAFLENATKLPRDEIESGVRELMFGQPKAVDAVVDAIALAKARLNDPTRPIGSFLFLGPTGVGKTQCAKAVAKYLFGSADRLVRFDMNEFNTPAATARLVGTLFKPEGQLTTAVKRQPHSVVLLDEIEKADPNVFDLLLQVIGEGRLTDALGRTTDFTNCIVILTSNLGSREAQGGVGFGGDPTDATKRDHARYMKAVEDFFRPEFVNRLDRIIPFDQLTKNDVHHIAHRHIEDLGGREGFLRRRCVLVPRPGIVQYVVQQGFEPKWGARGVRRFVEMELIRPVAAELARSAELTPTIVALDWAESGITVNVSRLDDAVRLRGTITDAELPDEPPLDAIRHCLNRYEETCRQHRPDGSITSGSIRPEQYYYLQLTEAIQALRNLVKEKSAAKRDHVHRRLAEQLESIRSVKTTRGRARAKIVTNDNRRSGDSRIMREMYAADDVRTYLNELVENAPDRSGTAWDWLAQRLALVDSLLPDEDGWHDETLSVLIRPLQGSDANTFDLTHALLDAPSIRFEAEQEDIDCACLEYERVLHSDVQIGEKQRPLVSQPTCVRLAELNCALIRIEGLRASRMYSREAGTHLIVLDSGRMIPVQVVVLVVSEDRSFEDVVAQALPNSTDHFAVDSPFAIKPVVRISQQLSAAPELWTTIDLATGISIETKRREYSSHMSSFQLGRLPLPREFREAHVV
ncbi:MAG: AAA family ATPase [Planctomycetota bacterium]|nr:AAA family ATPase [Planctomycetota bacterium]